MSVENISFFLDNVNIREPKNWLELSIELNFDKSTPGAKVKLNDWEFVIENATIINNWIAGGLIGGPGVFEGIPFRIEVTQDSITEIVFDGYLDTTELLNISCDSVTVTAKEKLSIDWLNDVADGFSFEYLASPSVGSITPADYIYQPYVVSSIPNYTDSAITIIGAFVITQELKASVEQLKELISDLSNVLNFTAIIKAVLYITYLTTLIAALIKLIKDLSTLIIQPVKYHAGMKIKTLFEAGCDHLGIIFKSSIFDSPTWANAVIIPEKYNNPLSADKSMFGFLFPDPVDQTGYYRGTFGDFVRDMQTMFKAKAMVIGGVLIFERKDFNLSIPKYKIEDIENRNYKLNTDEFISNFLVEFQTDTLEKNTIQDYQGTSYQTTLRPVIFHNNNFILMKGLQVSSIPFALAKRKEDLTFPEEVIKSMLEVVGAIVNALIISVNAVLKVFNSIVKLINKLIKAMKLIGIKLNFAIPAIPTFNKIDFGKIIENRIGMMKLDTDFINVPKVYLLEPGSLPLKNKIAANNATVMSAKYLWENFHYIDSFIPTIDRPTGNQRKIKNIEKSKFLTRDYKSVKEDNYAIDPEGNKVEIVSLEWNIWDQQAINLKYRIPYLYTNNLKQINNEPTGK